MRVTPEQAAQYGWISQDEAMKLAKKGKQRGSQAPKKRGKGRAVHVRDRAANDGLKAEKWVCSIDGDDPQSVLFRALVHQFKGWYQVSGKGKLAWEYKGAVPGRRFRLDIAFPEHHIAVEVDGFQYHAMSLEAWKKDHERDQLLTLEGWRVFRITAGEINDDVQSVVDKVDLLIERVEKSFAL